MADLLKDILDKCPFCNCTYFNTRPLNCNSRGRDEVGPYVDEWLSCAGCRRQWNRRYRPAEWTLYPDRDT